MGNNISSEDYDKEVFQSYRIPPKAYKKKKDNKSRSDSSAPASPSSVEFNAPPIYRNNGKDAPPSTSSLSSSSQTNNDHRKHHPQGQGQGQQDHQNALPHQQRFRSGSLSSSLDRARRERPISHPPASVLSNVSSSSSLNLSIVNAALAAASPSPSLYSPYSNGPVSAPLPIIYHGTGTFGARTPGGYSIASGSDSFDMSPHSLGSGLGRAMYIDGEIVEMGFQGQHSGDSSGSGSGNGSGNHAMFRHGNYTVQDFISYQQQQKQQFLEHQQHEYKQMLLLQQKRQQLQEQCRQQELLLQQQQQLLEQQQQQQQLQHQQQQVTGITLQTKNHRPARHPDRVNTATNPSQSVAIPSSSSSTSLPRQQKTRPYGPRPPGQSGHLASSPPPPAPFGSSYAGAASSFSSTGSQYQAMMAMTNSASRSSSSSSLSDGGSSAQQQQQQSSSDSTIGGSPRANKLGLSLDDLAAKILPPRRMLGGREYYPDKTLPYLLPCDEQEAERLLLQHYVIRYAFGSNTIPPIDTTLAGKVLDCGCGPGTWVMEMATDYPDLDFYGFDISPMYPSSIHPRNAHFSVGNLLDPEIPYISDSFLLVHQRNMLLGLTQEAWPGVVQDLYRCVVPGGQGWLQLSEVDPIWARPGPVSRSFLKMLNETAQTRSVDILLPQRLDQVLKDVGCENVKMMMVEIPIGPWGGKIGVLWRDVLKAEMEALKPVVLQAELEIALAKGQDVAVCGAEMTTSEEWDDMMVQVWAEMDQYHTYSRVYLAHGQKP